MWAGMFLKVSGGVLAQMHLQRFASLTEYLAGKEFQDVTKVSSINESEFAIVAKRPPHH